MKLVPTSATCDGQKDSKDKENKRSKVVIAAIWPCSCVQVTKEKKEHEQ